MGFTLDKKNIIAACVLLGIPLIEWYDGNYGVAASIRLKSYYDETTCKQTPEHCWIQINKKHQ